MTLYERPPWDAVIDPLVADIVARRLNYPDLANQQWDWMELAKRQLDHQPAELHETLLLLLENNAFHAFDGSAEEELFREATRGAGPDGWHKTMEHLTGTPRLQGMARAWLTGVIDLAEVEDWVGDDLERARLVASVTTPGSAQLNPVGRFLIANFGTDHQVASGLRMGYISGNWFGNYSARCQELVDQLTGWLIEPAEPQAVKDWAESTIQALEIQRDEALQREAEDH
jgi:hypothetical protein